MCVVVAKTFESSFTKGATALKIRVTISGVQVVTTGDAASKAAAPVNTVTTADMTQGTPALEKKAGATVLEIGVGHVTAALVVTATQMGTKALQIRTDTDQTVAVIRFKSPSKGKALLVDVKALTTLSKAL